MSASHYDQAAKALAAGNLEMADALFAAQLSLDLTHLPSLVDRGVASFALGKHERAAALFEAEPRMQCWRGVPNTLSYFDAISSACGGRRGVRRVGARSGCDGAAAGSRGGARGRCQIGFVQSRRAGAQLRAALSRDVAAVVR